MAQHRRIIVCALALTSALAACGRGGEAKGENLPANPQAQLAAALDTCAGGGADALSRAICGDPAMAELDTRIRRALQAEAGEVSEGGARVLLENHRRWLGAQQAACGMIDPDAAPDAAQRACLTSRLRQRAEQASAAVEQVGGYTFQRMEIVSAQAVSAEAASASGLGEDAPAAITRDIRFPRIDDSASPQAARFNALVAQQPQYRLEDQTEEQVSYRIAYAGPQLISVRFDTYENTLGSAHPNTGARAVTVVMTTGQPLTAADVFRAGSGWEDFLVQRATQALTRQFRDYDFTPSERDVRDSVTKPHLWLVTERGLVLLFPPLSFSGPRIDEAAEVEVPWADLARYLNPNAPAPIRGST
ncbi:MAG: hypothetical protein AB7J28_08800 [Hyphomonadaceae bacterium]